MILNTADAAAEPERIVFLGDSLTAGYGLNPEQSYPSLIEEKLREKASDAIVVNAGISGDTTAGGLHRLDWISKDKIDVLIIALGANDGLRGLDPALSKSNLVKIIEQTRSKFPDVRIVLAGMLVPTSMGGEYGKKFGAIFGEIATEQKVALVPFLLDGVAGVYKLNQRDGIHPTAEGQRILAENVWRVLEPVVFNAK